MACTSGCPTQDHQSWGECLRAKSLRVGYCRSATGGPDATAQKRHDSELAFYKQARAEGIQPAGTKRKQTETAMRISDAAGSAYEA